jgi:hypothetical protein
MLVAMKEHFVDMLVLPLNDTIYARIYRCIRHLQIHLNIFIQLNFRQSNANECRLWKRLMKE